MLTLLQQCAVAFVSFADWLALDRHERAQGEAEGRPRRKQVELAGMLAAIAAARSEAAGMGVSQTLSDRHARRIPPA